MRLARLLTSSLVAAGLLAVTAAAQTPSPEQKRAAMDALRQACASDAARLCPGVQAGEGRLAQCFKGHRAELSPICRSAIVSARQARAGVAAAAPH